MSFGTIIVKILKFTSILFLALFLTTVAVVSYIYIKIPDIEENQTILILGKAGQGHTAPNLTDTMIVMHVNSDSKKVSFLSLPRDIWIPEIRAKLNTAYHYGGFKMVNDSVYSITGTEVSKTVVFDFSLFRDLINTIGGIDVDVENSFVDEKYPIQGMENDLCDGDKTYSCRYEVLKFDMGIQHMDGDLALKFVRSRNAIGDEGTDLARQKRQQKVISAIQSKLLSSDVLLNPDTVKNLYDMAISHVETDIDFAGLISLSKFVFISRENINFLDFPEDLIQVSQNDKKFDMQYVFIPKDGSWSSFQDWIKITI